MQINFFKLKKVCIFVKHNLNKLKSNIMNEQVIKVLAESMVKFQAKCGNVITLEEAMKIEEARMIKLSNEDNFKY